VSATFLFLGAGASSPDSPISRVWRRRFSTWSREANESQHARRLEQATEALYPWQRSRLRRVFDAWDTQVQAQLILGASAPGSPPWPGDYEYRGRSLYGSSVPDLADYLESAHHHPVIARKNAEAVRAWFATWRRVAIRALRDGVDAQEVSTIVVATPTGRRCFKGPRLRSTVATGFDFLRERFAPLLYPNPPNRDRSYSSPVVGGESAAFSA
jgi:hypothetical protein